MGCRQSPLEDMAIAVNDKPDTPCQGDIIGLIPAGGQATRIAPLPCSKEVYPIGFRPADDGRGVRPKVVCHYLLEKMRVAGITKAYVILRGGKWDIPAYLRDGALVDMHLAYLMLGVPFGVPYTLDQAYPFVQDALVALGFPDVLFQPDDAFVQLLARQAAGGADVVLGLFPADRPEKVDMVNLDDAGRVRQIVIKPRQTRLCYSWTIAVWTPAFTRFMHEYLAVAQGSAAGRPELFVGDVVQAAIHDGLRVEAVQVSGEPFVDIGTPEDLVRAVRCATARAT
jgi:glucose-1-phosphate thymidylyltransferase